MKKKKRIKGIRNNITFFKHQTEGIKIGTKALKKRKKPFFIIADEQGLGKTIEAIGICNLMKYKRILVVSPLFVREEWARILKDYTHHSFIVLDTRESFLGRARFEMINYDRVRTLKEELDNRKYDCIICDEFHNIKNRKAKRTQALVTTGNKAQKLFLSGTPILNRTEELWTILNYGDPKKWPDYWAFVERYSKRKQIPIKIWRRGRQITIYVTKFVGGKNLKELRAKLKYCMIRRRKSEVLDLPPKIYQTLKVNLTGKQREVYEKLSNDLSVDLEGGRISTRGVLSKFTRLRQVCCGLEAVSKESSSAKINMLEQFCEDYLYEDHKFFIVSPFRSVALEAYNRLKRYGAVYVDGTVSPIDSRKRKSRFNRLKGTKLYVGTIGRNKEGITLTGADYVIFLGKSLVQKINEQVEDRAHRIGQKKTVTIVNILCKDTLEEKLEEMLFKKAKLFGELIDGVSLSSPVISTLADIRKAMK